MLGMLRVITRPEIDPTRSKQTNYPTRTRPEILRRHFYPTRPEPGFFRVDPLTAVSDFSCKCYLGYICYFCVKSVPRAPKMLEFAFKRSLIGVFWEIFENFCQKMLFLTRKHPNFLGLTRPDPTRNNWPNMVTRPDPTRGDY